MFVAHARFQFAAAAAAASISVVMLLRADGGCSGVGDVADSLAWLSREIERQKAQKWCNKQTSLVLFILGP